MNINSPTVSFSVELPQEFLLTAIILINIDILYQLLPFVRMDGYWALADLTGIPDFLSMTGPFLASILPLPGKKANQFPQFKPREKAFFAAYILLTLPLMMAGIIFMLLRLPCFFMAFSDSPCSR